MIRIFRSLEETPADFGPSVVTVGNFDGVHQAHRAILRRVTAIARERGLKASVLTFHPHPTRIITPGRATRVMTTPEERCALMAEEGIEQVLVLPFDAKLAHMSAEDFVEQILVNKLGVRAVLVGDNFRFGHKQHGDVRLLAELGVRFGFTAEVAPAIRMRGLTVSSSIIRQLLEAGKVGKAGRLLGRAYWLDGLVVKGEGVGARQTVPTLNLSTVAEVLPARGVYVTRTCEFGALPRSWKSITNIGFRPTFGGDRLTVETFLLHPLVGEAPASIRVEFLHRVRGERWFESPESLKAQIYRDVARAEVYFRRLEILGVRNQHDRLAGRNAP